MIDEGVDECVELELLTKASAALMIMAVAPRVMTVVPSMAQTRFDGSSQGSVVEDDAAKCCTGLERIQRSREVDIFLTAPQPRSSAASVEE